MRTWRTQGIEYEKLSVSTSLKARLHVTARFRSNDAALFQAIVLRSDDFQIHRSGIASRMQCADITDKVDVSPPVGLILRFARPLLPPLAIPDMHMLDPRDHGLDRHYRILVGPPDVRGIHVDTESRRRYGLHRP